MTLDRVALQAAVRWACELDVKALKPGNVSLDSPSYGMTAAEFIASAAAIVEPITMPGMAVGERIYLAIEATQRVVNCNTNLGIVMLLAPIVRAMEFAAGNNESLAKNLGDVLQNLSVADADWAYRAIRMANPGGMGSSAKYDIAETPSVTLLQAMQEATERDQIARLYTSGYELLLQRGVAVWRNALQCWGSEEWAMTFLYLDILAQENDSLITRKFGLDASRQVTNSAKRHCQAMQQSGDLNQIRAVLVEWDGQLKREGLNPGTSADMAVATVLLATAQDLL